MSLHFLKFQSQKLYAKTYELFMMSVVQSVENDQYWLVKLILPLFVGASHIRFEWWKKMYTSFC